MNKHTALMFLKGLRIGPDSHRRADDILISFLESEGFNEIVIAYRNIPRQFGTGASKKKIIQKKSSGHITVLKTGLTKLRGMPNAQKDLSIQDAISNVIYPKFLK